jgi:hypothetical protein
MELHGRFPLRLYCNFWPTCHRGTPHPGECHERGKKKSRLSLNCFCCIYSMSLKALGVTDKWLVRKCNSWRRSMHALTVQYCNVTDEAHMKYAYHTDADTTTWMQQRWASRCHTTGFWQTDWQPSVQNQKRVRCVLLPAFPMFLSEFYKFMVQLTWWERMGPIYFYIHTEGMCKILMNIFETNYCRWYCRQIFLGLGIITFPMVSNNTCLMIMLTISFQARKIDKKCKHLSYFPTVTLQMLC